MRCTPPNRNVCGMFFSSSVDNDTICYLDLMSIIDDCCTNVCAVCSADAAAAAVVASFILWLIHVGRFVYVCAVHVFTSDNRAITHLVKHNVKIRIDCISLTPPNSDQSKLKPSGLLCIFHS